MNNDSETDILRYLANSAAFRPLLTSIARWARALALLGIVFQALLLGYALFHLHQYNLYSASHPKIARSFAIAGIVELAQLAAYVYLYVQLYRFSVIYSELVRNGGEEERWRQAFELNLRLLKYQVLLICLTTLYYAWRLATETGILH